MIQFIVIFLAIYWAIYGLSLLIADAWPVLVGLILLAIAYGVISHLVRRRVWLRRQLVAIQVARDQASADLDRALDEAKAASWEEVRRHL